MKQYILMVFTIIFTMSNGYAEPEYEKFAVGKVVFPKQHLTITVEVARTKMQRRIGLMFRENLEINTGMLFDFKQEDIQRVWMKNTLIPLDIIFLSAKGNIVSILENVQPCIKEPCKIYDSTRPAAYMLEVNAGIVDRKQLETGDYLLFYF